MQTPLQRGFQSGCIFLRSTQTLLPARNLPVKQVMEGLNLQLEEIGEFHGCTKPTYPNNPFLTRELRACARASYRYDVGNGIRSIGRFL